MIPALIKMRGQVNDLMDDVVALKEQAATNAALALRDTLTTDDRFDRLSAQVRMMAAHVENLIDRVADLEGTPRPRRAWERSEPTSTDTPVSLPPVV